MRAFIDIASVCACLCVLAAVGVGVRGVAGQSESESVGVASAVVSASAAASPSTSATASPSGSTSTTASPAITSAGVDLLNANHILHFLDVVDAFGHVSVRSPENASQFIMSFAIAPALTTSQSLVTYDIDNATALHLTFNSSVQGADIPSGFLERFIHSQIYKAFPSVQSVVHAHTAEVLPFGNAGVGLRAQMGTAGSVGALAHGTPIFDTALLPASVLPPSAPHDLLIRDEALGDALAAKFVNGTSTGSGSGQGLVSAVVLMRGHGMVVVSDHTQEGGEPTRDVVFRAFYAKQSAIAQMQALTLLDGKSGASTGLSAREAADAAVTNEGAALLGRAWDLWVRQVGLQGLYVNDLV